MKRIVGSLALGALSACSEPQAPPQLNQELRLEPVSALVQPVPVTGSVGALPRVRVVDRNGVPQVGVHVHFVRAIGQPILSGTLTPSNVSGEAVLTSWHVGTRAGPQEVRAVLARNTSDTRVVFRVDVQPGPASHTGLSADTIRIAVGQTSTQLSLARRDAYGNVVSLIPGATITSDDPAVAEVLPDGSVRGVATGRVAVVVDSGSFRRAALVIVGTPPNGVRTQIAASANPVYAVASGPTGLAYAAPIANTPSVLFRLAPGTTAPTTLPVDSAHVIDAAFHPDGARVLFVGLERRYVLVVNAATGDVSDVVPLPGPSYRVAISIDGAFAVVTGSSRVWRIEMSGYAVTEFPLPQLWGPVNGLAIHPTDDRIYVTSHEGEVAVLDPLTGAVEQFVNGLQRLQGLAIDPVSNRLYVGREEYGIRVLDAETLAHISDSNQDNGAFDLRWEPVRRELWVSRGAAGGVLRYSASALVPLERFPLPGARRLTVLPTGDVVVGGETGLYLIAR